MGQSGLLSTLQLAYQVRGHDPRREQRFIKCIECTTAALLWLWKVLAVPLQSAVV